MLPKTGIIYSWIYNRELNRDKTAKYVKDHFAKLESDCKKFEKLYKKHILKILKLIPKYTKKEWEKEYIPIYIVFRDGYSFHSPLTLKYNKNVRQMFFELIHELIHNNIEEHGYNAERKIDEIAHLILKRLKL